MMRFQTLAQPLLITYAANRKIRLYGGILSIDRGSPASKCAKAKPDTPYLGVALLGCKAILNVDFIFNRSIANCLLETDMIVNNV